MKERRAMSKSSTTTDKSEWLRNPHAGEILLDEFSQPMGLSQSTLAVGKLDAIADEALAGHHAGRSKPP
jgi:hypothetical protein